MNCLLLRCKGIIQIILLLRGESLMTSLSDYTDNKEKYITTFGSEFYPDTLDAARAAYESIYNRFCDIVNEAHDSIDLFNRINDISGNIRVQLMRIFNRYVSPNTSVEMLKRKSKSEEVINGFSHEFRPLVDVQKKISESPNPNLPLYALLYEYQRRGQKGYNLTEDFFNWFYAKFSQSYQIKGQKRAGQDIILSNVLAGYKEPDPVDFIIEDHNSKIKVVGYARYDSDRGGSQEDDRVDGNRDKVTHLKEYNRTHNDKIKCIFINDGPGLLLGSMWRDYIAVENMNPDSVMVLTLKMLDKRLTKEWIERSVSD